MTTEADRPTTDATTTTNSATTTTVTTTVTPTELTDTELADQSTVDADLSNLAGAISAEEHPKFLIDDHIEVELPEGSRTMLVSDLHLPVVATDNSTAGGQRHRPGPARVVGARRLHHRRRRVRDAGRPSRRGPHPRRPSAVHRRRRRIRGRRRPSRSSSCPATTTVSWPGTATRWGCSSSASERATSLSSVTSSSTPTTAPSGCGSSTVTSPTPTTPSRIPGRRLTPHSATTSSAISCRSSSPASHPARYSRACSAWTGTSPTSSVRGSSTARSSASSGLLAVPFVAILLLRAAVVLPWYWPSAAPTHGQRWLSASAFWWCSWSSWPAWPLAQPCCGSTVPFEKRR